eukprot:jgi/Picsp_1/4174/NSC_01683-R1_at1g64350 f15h21_2
MCDRVLVSVNAASTCQSRRKQVRSAAMIFLSSSGRTRGSMLTHKDGITSFVDSNKCLRRRQPGRSLTISKIWPFDQAWGISIDSKTLSETIPQNLFAFSIIPYVGFLYHFTKSKKAPPLTLFGFYFLLVFVFATIPAGIYAKKAFGTTLANIDYLHGSAEFMLTLTNLFIVLGLRKAIREAEAAASRPNQDNAES